MSKNKKICFVLALIFAVTIALLLMAAAFNSESSFGSEDSLFEADAFVQCLLGLLALTFAFYVIPAVIFFMRKSWIAATRTQDSRCCG